MLFSLKPGKALAETQQTNIVSTEVDLANGHKIFARTVVGVMASFPLVLSAIVDFDFFYAQMALYNSFLFVATPVVGSSVMGIFLSKSYLRDMQEQRILDQLGHGATSKAVVSQAFKPAQRNRTLLSSFSIREAIDDTVDSWRKAPLDAVCEDDATHTVNHYLIKDRKGYRLEQEVIPNDETIWDLSADALVEVYGVQEVKSVEA